VRNIFTCRPGHLRWYILSADMSSFIVTMRPLLRNPLVRCRYVHVEAKMAKLGLKMPTPAVPKGNFVNYVPIGNNLVFLSGHLPQVR
jgi:hypothetical protein